jgi:hypothetical protein
VNSSEESRGCADRCCEIVAGSRFVCCEVVVGLVCISLHTTFRDVGFGNAPRRHSLVRMHVTWAFF